MLNVLTRENDKLVLHGFSALKDNAVIKYGDGLMVIDSRPYKQLDNQFRVTINEDRTITNKNALIVAEALCSNKHTLFIEAEGLYYIQDLNFNLPDTWTPDK